MPRIKLNAVIFQEEGTWVAQCLEYDIAAQAETLADLSYELNRVLIGHVVISEENSSQPFCDLPPAPQEYWDRHSQAMDLVNHRSMPFRPTPPASVNMRIAA